MSDLSPVNGRSLLLLYCVGEQTGFLLGIVVYSNCETTAEEQKTGKMSGEGYPSISLQWTMNIVMYGTQRS